MASKKQPGLYEVKELVQRRRQKRTYFYRVRWMGYSAAEDTWEPRRHLQPYMYKNFDKKLACEASSQKAVARVEDSDSSGPEEPEPGQASEQSNGAAKFSSSRGPKLNLSNEELKKRVLCMHPVLSDIWKGQLQCKRHELYMQDGLARRSLDNNIPLNLLEDLQEDIIMNILVSLFKPSVQQTDYLLRVLLPEVLIRIQTDVLGNSLEKDAPEVESSINDYDAGTSSEMDAPEVESSINSDAGAFSEMDMDAPEVEPSINDSDMDAPEVEPSINDSSAGNSSENDDPEVEPSISDSDAGASSENDDPEVEPSISDSDAGASSENDDPVVEPSINDSDAGASFENDDPEVEPSISDSDAGASFENDDPEVEPSINDYDAGVSFENDDPEVEPSVSDSDAGVSFEKDDPVVQVSMDGSDAVPDVGKGREAEQGQKRRFFCTIF